MTIVSHLMDISSSYVSHSVLHVPCDSLILKYPVNMIQCVGSSYCSNDVYILVAFHDSVLYAQSTRNIHGV